MNPTLPVTASLQAAVIGLGGMGKRHIQALEGLTQRLAICDQRPETLKSMTGHSAGYLDWHELIEKEGSQLDLLIVATNGPSHVEIATAAARAGVRHILVEKPMATSGEAARRLAAVCSESGTKLAINFSRRFMERYRDLKARLRDKPIGEISHIHVAVGAGGLGCIGSHWFDLVEWLVESPADWVMGMVDKNPEPCVRGKQFFDPGGKGVVHYTSGVTAFFDLSEQVAVMPRLEIVGSQGFIQVNEFTAPNGGRMETTVRPSDQWHVQRTRWVQPVTQEWPVSGPLNVVEASRCCIQEFVHGTIEDTVQPGIRGIDTVMAFHLSSQKDWGKVPLPLSGDHLKLDVPIT